MSQLLLIPDADPWRQVTKWHRGAVEMADRHYSRQSVGSDQFLPPGRTLVLFAEGPTGAAVWAAVENLDPVGTLRFRCTIFRNESGLLSSSLIMGATAHTQTRWHRRWGWTGLPRLTTEIDPQKVRRKRDPGRCFIRAGWHYVGMVRGLVVLEAPMP